ncbi:hypothetical protein NQT69_01655 [Pseudoalteromonas shioyasakiensis]|uniref:hypothetical protein n=1 Tax=Pseudoalteromonas shioyasakiensis TaxID=1190813 RepID=UPI002118E55E|nr:hypothetical protein [Pseudoalteromonas shioyasakiensis]MCQ8876739.1 hypothetical protein [Pseudoalteromonas shioyasakiensis]
MKKNQIKLAVIAATVTASFQFVQAAQCPGQLYGINAGRGDTGVVFKLNESKELVEAHSLAKFSSSALAYVEPMKRLYYVAVPRPLEYKVDVSHLELDDSKLSSLAISGSKFRYIKLAYVDLDTNEHVEVGRTANVYGLTYDSTNNQLIGFYNKKLYAIDPDSAETTELGAISGINDSGYWRGDLVYQGSQLVLITSKSIYNINKNTLKATKRADHSVGSVTGATFGQQGNLLVTKTILTDLGHANKTYVYNLDIDSGNSIKVATLPARINDLATSSQMTDCYTESLPTPTTGGSNGTDPGNTGECVITQKWTVDYEFIRAESNLENIWGWEDDFGNFHPLLDETQNGKGTAAVTRKGGGPIFRLAVNGDINNSSNAAVNDYARNGYRIQFWEDKWVSGSINNDFDDYVVKYSYSSAGDVESCNN